ncbi:hypothetical protein RHSIM_Rhsim13G0130100 [Rhododendron simsii]|uniref:Uncharacterized protein n=1 Tax=Rhododendron simsii TaxID=118357 RepID=A0A834FZ45_RHOSS|nr:hypothetical protein RHSIM_Rhsim13G0130100 [Rhododendron simsii]
MADGTISMIDGLGSKAIDSNEMRRKQKNSSESAPILVQDDTVTQVGNKEQSVGWENPNQCSRPPLDSHPLTEEISDSENELLEVLGGVGSSDQEVGALNHYIRTTTSSGSVQSEFKSSPAPEPPDSLGLEVKKEAAEQVSKGSTIFNKYLSKSAKKRLKKQAKKELISPSATFHVRRASLWVLRLVAAIMVEISCYITRASDDDDAVAAVLTASSARSEGDVLCIVYSPFSAFIPYDYATLLLYYCTMLLLSHGRNEFVQSQLVQQNSQIGQTLCLFCYVHSYHEGSTWENSTPNLAADCCVRSCLLLQMLLHLRFNCWRGPSSDRIAGMGHSMARS